MDVIYIDNSKIIHETSDNTDHWIVSVYTHASMSILVSSSNCN